ncbi:hypothetical protein [Evansella tamaricis]|uniref:Uncharacterized protein n=1 Tax=Evansella tamaricis TaxID=2069301 RepID=A0ABS6JHF0_9BACI|nr:hypothetical protein [Evansella tamaricis]MBU9712282.1 hypothetical protein [Evansella tamaricis]
MIIYFGVMKELIYGKKESVIQQVPSDIGSIGFWFTSDVVSAKPYAIGKETVLEKSKTEFWEDGEPKVIQVDKTLVGYVYRVYINEQHLKIYESDTVNAHELFMEDRDNYCDYYSAKKRNLTWRDKPILLNKDDANTKFRDHLISQNYEGFLIRNSKRHHGVTDLYCLFSIDSIHISEVIPVINVD